MTRGALIYAYNNTEIDYFKIAYANALMIRKNLGIPVTVVTDNSTIEWGITSLGQDNIDKCFDQVIETDRDYQFDNKRTFKDSVHASKTLQFYNCDHWSAYQLSPYDETLFIDADYLIMSNALDKCWGSDNDIMVDSRIYSPGGLSDPAPIFIDDFGIKQYWATVIYFKKTELSEMFFNLVGHIQENYHYYRDLYYFSNGMFRNDYAVSIAIHTLNGFVPGNLLINELPIPGLLMSWDTDDIQSVPSENNMLIYTQPDKTSLSPILVRINGTDTHVMNKWAINRVADRLIEIYR